MAGCPWDIKLSETNQKIPLMMKIEYVRKGPKPKLKLPKENDKMGLTEGETPNIETW